MNREKALAIVKKELTDKRFVHTIGVTDTAIQLAKRYGADEKKAELAGIFHDYAKYRPKEEMKEIIKTQKLPKDLLANSSELWHAPVGAYLVKEIVGIHDEEVLSAIRFHTTGRAHMAKLEKILFLADYIEPNRSFPGVEKARELAKKNLNEAVLLAVGNTIQFLITQQQLIYPQTLETYNCLLRELSQKN